jgi:hypothetical protein
MLLQRSFSRLVARCGAAALLAISFAAGAAQAPVQRPLDADLHCGGGIAPVALPPGSPDPVHAPADWRAVRPDGSYNWSPAYDLQAMVYHLAATGDPAWAARIVDGGDALLATRDAPSPADRHPYAWFDRSANVSRPYVWLAYAGHNFAPLMQFARIVATDPRIGDCVYRGRPLRAAARSYLGEFDRVLRAHRDELAHKDGYSYFVFRRPVPVSDARLQGEPLPVNMNSDLFLAVLHSAAAESAFGEQGAAAERRTWVRQYVQYLTRSVLQRLPCAPGRTCLQWRYATYMDRVDDIGHANIVAKFLLDAYEDGYGVRRDDLSAFANTMDHLVDANGDLHGNLLDGETIPGVAQAVYYEILYGAFSPELKAKMERLVARTGGFAYTAAWLREQQLAGATAARVPAVG